MESRSVLRLIRYHWATIVVCAVLGVIAGQVFALITPREYTASADVFVTVTGGTTTGEIAQSGNFSQQQARNFSAIATREVVLAPVIKDLELDLTINQLRKQVSTSVPLNTSVITISVADASPQRAAAIANSVSTYLAEVVPALTPKVEGESPVRLQIIEAATAPANPSSPNVPLMLVLGLMGGLVVASAIVVVRGVLDARVRTKDDITEITGAPVLGSIAFDRRAAKQPVAITGDAHSLRSEEYRLLRANLRFLQAGQSQRILVFTSSIPGEGKSSTAANAAAALAASGLTVCLVEGDLRRPALAGVLDLPPGIGLTSIIMGDVSLDEALLDWGADGLKVLLSGPLPPNPSELLESTTTLALLQTIKQRFDVTIIDSPPLNPVSDAAVLARVLGGVVLIVGAGRVRTRDLRRAVDRLAAVGAHIDGAVLNLARSSDTRRYRYSQRHPYSDLPSEDVAEIEESPAATGHGHVARTSVHVARTSVAETPIDDSLDDDASEDDGADHETIPTATPDGDDSRGDAETEAETEAEADMSTTGATAEETDREVEVVSEADEDVDEARDPEAESPTDEAAQPEDADQLEDAQEEVDEDAAGTDDEEAGTDAGAEDTAEDADAEDTAEDAADAGDAPDAGVDADDDTDAAEDAGAGHDSDASEVTLDTAPVDQPFRPVRSAEVVRLEAERLLRGKK